MTDPYAEEKRWVFSFDLNKSYHACAEGLFSPSIPNRTDLIGPNKLLLWLGTSIRAHYYNHTKEEKHNINHKTPNVVKHDKESKLLDALRPVNQYG